MKLLRSLHPVIKQTLQKKMVFIGGPRQVGKTTLALQFLSPASVKNPAYLNWDRVSDQKLILKDQLPLERSLLVLDEIHKYRNWRNWLKGLYDKYHEDTHWIVTGSARLDYFMKGGDSLLGRYRYYRLHPFSVNELGSASGRAELESLLQLGGFPEPLFSKSETEARIWRRERTQRVVQDDLRDLETIKEISLLLLLAELLPERVGSPLSMKSLSEDLQVSQPTVDRWIRHLSHLYYCFLIPPYGAPKIRAVKKLQKLYLWDWAQVENSGTRFENMVASQLLKYCHWVEDTEGFSMELRYLRDTDEREVDFVVVKNKKPIFAVECKTGEKSLSRHIRYFQERLQIPEYYQVHLGSRDYGHAKTGRVLPFLKFCKEMEMP